MEKSKAEKEWENFMPLMAKHIAEQEVVNKEQREIYQLLVGNEKAKQKGLFERVSILEEDKSKRGFRNAFILGGSIAGALGLNKLIDFITKM